MIEQIFAAPLQLLGSDRLGIPLSYFRLQLRQFTVWQPEIQFIPVGVINDEGRFPPIIARGLNPFSADVLAKRLRLLRLETNERAAVPCPFFGVVENLVEDKLESEETDLKNAGPTLVLIVPIDPEAERFRIEGQRGFAVSNKEDTSRVEVIHSTP